MVAQAQIAPWFADRAARSIQIHWQGHELSAQDLSSKDRRELVRTLLSYPELSARKELYKGHSITVAIEDSKICMNNPSLNLSKEIELTEKLGSSLPQLLPALASAGFRKRKALQAVPLSVTGVIGQWFKKKEDQVQGIEAQSQSLFSQASNITSVIRNSSHATASFFKTALALAVAGVAVPVLGFLGGFFALASGVLGTHLGVLAERAAVKIGDLEGKLYAQIDQAIWVSVVALGPAMVLVFLPAFAALGVALTIFSLVLMNVALGGLYIGFLIDSLKKWKASCEFRSEFKEAIAQGQGVEFLRKRLYLTPEEEAKIQTLPIEQQAKERENQLAVKLEHLIRRTNAETVEEVVQKLAENPAEADSQDLFDAVQRANYANRKKLLFKMLVSAIGIGATIVTALVPAAAPGCILYGIGAIAWQINDTSALHTLTKKMGRDYYKPAPIQIEPALEEQALLQA